MVSSTVLLTLPPPARGTYLDPPRRKTARYSLEHLQLRRYEPSKNQGPRSGTPSKRPSLSIVLGRSESTTGYPRGVLDTESFASLNNPCWTDASPTSRATISGGSFCNVLTVRLSGICLFVADSFHWPGHYKAWLSGVHHRRISAFNLMYKRREDGTIVGVLIDLESAILLRLWPTI